MPLHPSEGRRAMRDADRLQAKERRDQTVTFTRNAAFLAALWTWIIPLPVIGLLWLVGAL